MAAASEQEQDSSRCTCWLLLAAGFVAAMIVTIIAIVCTTKDPVYSVTVTGVAGLDDPSSSSSSLSPVFNLTMRIDNSGELMMSEACIDRLSTVAVLYGDAPLGRGSVPQFCAGGGNVRERGARAWAQGVVLPQFLRDQLAGELAAGVAAVDVKVTTPADDFRFGDTVFVCSQAKIGGGPAPCRKERVYHQQQAN